MLNQEERAAQKNAAAALVESSDTIFGKIVRGEIPCRKVYEDEKCLAFHDVNPQAPVHIILIPKEPNGLTRLSKAKEAHQDILGHLMIAVAKIAAQEDLGDFRVVINDGPGAAQSVYHLHLHILAKRPLLWPPG
ncbi:diadenosine tetraphosphatase family protein [Cardiosporidium cionae]|uniref:Diadenosine tetraphosphatase family protein n=1 Tax=Cardiosporidium cionae TaxID=476202 RepID=A0ABQ7JFA5_9APIC|nr:diadenosine tetraphosphatase family protein [Cardiosporidium cionae]|eukprot:KAF8822696.1 diadenosine tetraphosphatase family protein [Cardiosporidium cionae]